MNLHKAVTVMLCISTGCLITATAGSHTESDMQFDNDPSEQVVRDSLGVEYEKLLRIVQEKRKPVQIIDGSLDIAGRPGIGPKDAEVVLVEFGDFQCAYCRRHLQDAAQKIHEKLVSTQRLRYVFLDFPIESKHPMAAKVAVAARCAEEQGAYWKMRNILFNNQKTLHEVYLVEHAKAAGMEVSMFIACLKSGRHDTAILQDQIVGRSLEIRGTPTFFLGINNGNDITLVRKIVGSQPYEVFERAIFQASEIAKK